MVANVWNFLTCAQMLQHATAHRRCADTVEIESALEVDSGGKNILSHLGLEPASVLRLAFKLSDIFLPSFPSLETISLRFYMSLSVRFRPDITVMVDWA